MNTEQELRLHGPFKTDDFASYIYGSNDKIGGDNPVLEIRGWGYLTGNGHGALGLSHAEAVAEQKRFASFVVDALNAASPPAVAAGGVTGRNAMVVELSAMLTDYYPDDDDGTAAVSIPAKQLHRWLTAALAVGREGDLVTAVRKLLQTVHQPTPKAGSDYWHVTAGKHVEFGKLITRLHSLLSLPTPPSRGEGV